MTYSKKEYSLPVKKKHIILAISHPKGGHVGPLEHSIDFAIPEGTPIYASRAGKVVDVKVDSNEGGLQAKYIGNKYLNYITLDHGDNEYTQYLHLKHKGSLVKVGERVREGEKMAISGNTGLSSTPHLHFHVLHLNDTPFGWQTVKPRFNEKLYVDRKNYAVPSDQKKLIEKIKKEFKDLEKKKTK